MLRKEVGERDLGEKKFCGARRLEMGYVGKRAKGLGEVVF